MEETDKLREELVTRQCFQYDRKQSYENKVLHALHLEKLSMLKEWHSLMLYFLQKHGIMPPLYQNHGQLLMAPPCNEQHYHKIILFLILHKVTLIPLYFLQKDF